MAEGTTTPLTNEIRIASGSGSINVIAEHRSDVDAGSGGLLKLEDGVVNVVGHRNSTTLNVRCPEGADVVIGTRSGSISLKGRFGAVRAQAMSGRIDLHDAATSADMRTMSGSIHVATCTGMCRAKTKSGHAHIESAGSVDVAVGSGRIEVDHVHGSVRARAISGSITLTAEGTDRIEAETMSGSIVIGLPENCRPHVRAKSLSRAADIELPAGDDVEVVARTLSGGITVKRR
jgi:DUF4097 and DUF4098 domain-containing protein YvlB